MNMPVVEGVRFLPVVGLDGYAVGDDGSVWSCWTVGGHGRKALLSQTWRRLAGGSRKGSIPYQYVSLRIATDERQTRYIHHLVLEAFSGPFPNGMVARHLDGNPQNNQRSNLVWGTRQENEADKDRHGRRRFGEKHQNAKLTTEEVRQLRKLRKGGMSRREVAKRFGVSVNTVSNIMYGRTWTRIS